eukprot:6188716-Pleurochrysis_carterae.AAC.4
MATNFRHGAISLLARSFQHMKASLLVSMWDKRGSFWLLSATVQPFRPLIDTLKQHRRTPFRHQAESLEAYLLNYMEIMCMPAIENRCSTTLEQCGGRRLSQLGCEN